MNPERAIELKTELYHAAVKGGYLEPGFRVYRKVLGKLEPVPTVGKPARAMIREYEKRHHLPVTGTFAQATQDSLVPPPAPNPNVEATDWLLRFLGPKEQYGSNDGPWLRAHQDPLGDSYMHNGHVPYCAEVGGHVAYAEAAGIDLVREFPTLGNAAYCPLYVAAARRGDKSRSGHWRIVAVPHAAIIYGDILLFDWPGESIGLADHFGHATGRPFVDGVATVEANTTPGPGGNQSDGGGIWKRTRSLSTVLQAARIVPA